MMEESSEGVRDEWRGGDGSTGPGGVCGGDMSDAVDDWNGNEAVGNTRSRVSCSK